jgi:hypothetical protein
MLEYARVLLAELGTQTNLKTNSLNIIYVLCYDLRLLYLHTLPGHM